MEYWSKTTLITSSVSGTGANPPFCKMDTFFLRSLARSVPIYRHFQSNRANWRSSEHFTKKGDVLLEFSSVKWDLNKDNTLY